MDIETSNQPLDAGQKKEGAENGAGGDAAHPLSRRARVRRLLIEPLAKDGLIRAKGVTLEEHAAFLDKLADKVGYLDDAMLATLAELVLNMAEGVARNHWPSFATIWNIATRLRRPPDDESHIMCSWLVSVAGPIAQEAGHLVELYLWLRKHGCPPSDFALKAIRQEASENARTRARIARDVQAGSARASDADWLDGYLSTLAYCEALVARGAAKRAGGAA